MRGQHATGKIQRNNYQHRSFGLYGTLNDPGASSDPESVQNCSVSDPGTCRPISAE